MRRRSQNWRKPFGGGGGGAGEWSLGVLENTLVDAGK